MPLTIDNSAEIKQRRDSQVASRNERVNMLANAHATQMQANANYENNKNATDLATTDQTNQTHASIAGLQSNTELAKQKLANSAAENLANINNAGELEKVKTQGTTAFEIQKQQDKGAMDRTVLTEAGAAQRLSTTGVQHQREQNMTLAGQALMAGLPGNQAQQIADGSNNGANAFLSSVQVPQKTTTHGYEYVKPTVDVLSGKTLVQGGVLDKDNGTMQPAQMPGSQGGGGQVDIGRHTSALSAMNDPGKQKQYLQSLKIIDPQAYSQMMSYYQNAPAN